MEDYVYNKPEAIEYVEANFIPILIDAGKQPEITRQYNVNYWPTFCIKYPHTDEISVPLSACIPNPKTFIERIGDLLNSIKPPNQFE